MKLNRLMAKRQQHGQSLSGAEQRFEYRPSAYPKNRKGKNPYEQFAATELILRDQLAIDRTVLANERTFLAYCRTSLALILSGAGCIKFFESIVSDLAGWILIALGLVVSIIGVWRSSIIARNIRTAGKGRREEQDQQTR
jgi:putative membrane protein